MNYTSGYLYYTLLLILLIPHKYLLWMCENFYGNRYSFIHSLGSKKQCQDEEDQVIDEEANNSDDDHYEEYGTDDTESSESEKLLDKENLEESIEDVRNEDGRNKGTEHKGNEDHKKGKNESYLKIRQV